MRVTPWNSARSYQGDHRNPHVPKGCSDRRVLATCIFFEGLRGSMQTEGELPEKVRYRRRNHATGTDLRCTAWAAHEIQRLVLLKSEPANICAKAKLRNSLLEDEGTFSARR